LNDNILGVVWFSIYVRKIWI